jgi:hypothetical protein
MNFTLASLLLVNGATGLLLGLSVPFAVGPIPGVKHGWSALAVVLAFWATAIMVAWLMPSPTDLIVRRCINATAELWVAYLLWHTTHERTKVHNV